MEKKLYLVVTPELHKKVKSLCMQHDIRMNTFLLRAVYAKITQMTGEVYEPQKIRMQRKKKQPLKIVTHDEWVKQEEEKKEILDIIW